MGAKSFQALTFPMPIATYRSSLKTNTNLPSQPLWATIPTTTYPWAWLPAPLLLPALATSYNYLPWAYFQQLMNEALAGIPQVFCNLDDVIVMSRNPTDHERTLNQVFSRLRDHGLVVNQDKCFFGVNSLSFLGFKVSEQEFSPLPIKV